MRTRKTKRPVAAVAAIATTTIAAIGSVARYLLRRRRSAGAEQAAEVGRSSTPAPPPGPGPELAPAVIRGTRFGELAEPEASSAEEPAGRAEPPTTPAEPRQQEPEATAPAESQETPPAESQETPPAESQETAPAEPQDDSRPEGFAAPDTGGDLPEAPAGANWSCQCGQEYRVTGEGRHRMFWLPDAAPEDPVLDDRCPQCGRELSLQD